jgi:hypothetical protein
VVAPGLRVRPRFAAICHVVHRKLSGCLRASGFIRKYSQEFKKGHSPFPERARPTTGRATLRELVVFIFVSSSVVVIKLCVMAAPSLERPRHEALLVAYSA